MALAAGRVGVAPDQVDNNGHIIGGGGGGSVDTYTKEEIDQKLSGKANTSDVYTQSQVDTLLNGKADKSDTYTKDATNNILLDLLPDLFDTPPNVEASGNPLVLTDSAGGNAAECIVTLEPIQSGSGTPSPSNPLPISGHTQAKIYRRGANLWDGTFYNQKYWSDAGVLTDFSNNSCAGKMFVIGGASYYVSNPGVSFTFKWFDSNDSLISKVEVLYYSTNRIITAPDNAIYVLVNGGSPTFPNTFSVNYPSTNTAVNPPEEGTDYIIQLGQTVYGGTLDVTSGVLTIDRVLITLDGSETPQGVSSNYPGSLIYNTSSTTFSGIDFSKIVVCDKLKSVTSLSNFVLYSCLSAWSTSFNFWVRDTAFADVNEAKTWLSNNNLTVACYLTTPTTVQLTAEEVTLLKGDNVLTTNGTSIALSYPVDVASYIRRKLGMSTESTRALSKSLASEEIQEEVKEVSDLTPLEEVVEINTVEPVATVTTTKTTKRTSTKKSTRRK